MHPDFTHYAAENPEAVAVIDADGTVWTRGRLAALVHRLARALVSAGFSPEDSIAIVAPNCAEYLAIYLAGIQAGLFVVPVNWHLSEAELTFVLEDSEARAIFVHQRLGNRQLAAIAANRSRTTVLSVIGAAPGFVPLRDLAAPHSPEPIRLERMGRMMAYTSATTGRPKAVHLPPGNARSALDKFVAWHESLGVERGGDNVHLCSSMLYHSAPLQGAVIALHMGHRVVLVDRWAPLPLLGLIERHRVTTTFMVPTMFVRLLKLPASIRRRHSTSSLRFVIHGGAPCPVDVKRRMLEWWGNVIWESYGAAEGQGTIVSPQEWLEYPGTVGRPVPGSRVRILGDRGEDLPPHTVGKIYFVPHTGDRFAYKGDAEKTRRSYHGDYITVGDIGYVNAQGYLFVHDRQTDLILSAGMNIYPAEIEMILVQHPEVVDCAVLGVPHPLMGQVPKAFVELAPGAKPGSKLTADILSFLAERLSAMKLPKRVEYLASIPRDPTGKLYRRRLRDGQKQ